MPTNISKTSNLNKRTNFIVLTKLITLRMIPLIKIPAKVMNFLRKKNSFNLNNNSSVTAKGNHTTINNSSLDKLQDSLNRHFKLRTHRDSIIKILITEIKGVVNLLF